MKVTVDATGAGHDRGSVLTVEDSGLSEENLTSAIETYAMSHGNKAASNVRRCNSTDKDWIGVYVDMLDLCRRFPVEMSAIFPSRYDVYSCWGGNSDVARDLSFEGAINEARRLHAQMSVYRSIVDPTMTESDEMFWIGILPLALSENGPSDAVTYDYDQPDTPQPKDAPIVPMDNQQDLLRHLESFVRDCVQTGSIDDNSRIAPMAGVDHRTVGDILKALQE